MENQKSNVVETPPTPKTPAGEDSVDCLVRQVQRGVIYAMTEDYMTKWERGELRFKVGDDRVDPVVHGRTGDGFNVSFA
jgi:hypothetical protein